LSQYPPQYPQYPPPYGAPQNPYGGYPAPQGPPASPDQLLAPARRAGITMVVLGALAVLCGLGLAFMGAFCLTPEMMQQNPGFQQAQQQLQQAERELGMTVQKLFVLMGAVPLAAGAILGALGFTVRNGSRGAVTGSMVFVSILLAVLALVMGGGALQALANGGGPEVLLGLCFYAVPFALLAVVMFWLVQAARAAPKVEWARQHYQQQLWQYQQQQQAYLQNAPQPQQPAGAPPPPGQQPPAPGMGYHIATPPISPGASEKKDPPDAPPPAAG